VRLLASRPTPNLEDQVSLFVWLLPFDLSGLGGPASSYATAGIALRVSGALKPHHHDKVGIASVGIIKPYYRKLGTNVKHNKVYHLYSTLFYNFYSEYFHLRQLFNNHSSKLEHTRLKVIVDSFHCPDFDKKKR
jgi:hypothetical protein